MYKIMASLLAGFGLFLAIPAPAAEMVRPGKQPVKSAMGWVEIKGKLHRVKGEFKSNPPIPFDYWELLAGGKTYYLDLRGKELPVLAEKLNGWVVVVTGILHPSSPTIWVTGLKADEYIKVEIKGKLSTVLRPLPGRRFPYDRDDRFPMPTVRFIEVWTITAGGKTYDLTFGSDDLRKLAEKVKGKTVVVTGTPENYTILVTSMKADLKEGPSEYTKVEIKGQVQRRKVTGHPFGGNSYECWAVTLNGQRYELDFGGLKDVAEMATNLQGKVVVISGVLEVIRPRASGMQIGNAIGSWPLMLPGKMIIHVGSLQVARDA
jgi:hypothetical protein